jgi:hypothetical protein
MIPYKSGQLLALVIAGACGISAFTFYQYEVQKEKNQHQQALEVNQALSAAEDFLKHTHPLRAAQILNESKPLIEAHSDAEKKWKELIVASALALQDDKQLFSLWLEDPTLLVNNEELSLKAASYALSNNDLDNYHRLSEKWIKDGNNQKWTLLQADAHAVKGDPEKALILLSAAPLQDDLEVERLIRLALLNQNEHPKVSWDYLLKALALSPNLADVHLYRAQLLEGSNRSDLAALEYKEALAKNQTNPLLREELVDFYFRRQELNEAVDVLQSALKSQSSDKLWMRAIFLSKVFQPSKVALANEHLPSGTATPFIRYLLAIPPTEFWNEALLTSQPAVEKMAADISEANWLQVFEQLKVGNDAQALNILQAHPEMAILNPPLYEGLQKAIVVHHPYLNTSIVTTPGTNSGHPVFAALSTPELTKEYKALLASKESYAALALASGWFEAALNLQEWYPGKPISFAAISPELPRWVAYGFAKALVANRSNEEALSFINSQPTNPQLSLLSGELNLKLRQYAAAEKALSPYAKVPSALGAKSALLLSHVYSALGKFMPARQAILDNKELANSIPAKEALARLELIFGDPDLAERMYASIGESSTEAKSFFAKKAFKAGDYKTAYKLTKLLAEQFPERQDLKAQLNQITQAATANQKS